ncbi:MAG: type II toxin-antitoxin system VapC family toxin [Tildeniella nuda ZEHNDER 1965/U140]|nr:type II toxin-antitoxin system VapC family toxin [Tildeniella nuda ZEHNDER 1965/U140]
MKLLLDTHAFIWLDSNPSRLSERVRSLLQDPNNTLLLSVVSIWEMQIKIQIEKLQISLSLAELVESQRQANMIEILPISLPHVLALDHLPLHHKDPFDRLMVAQANIESATLVSQDETLSRYSVQLIW